jgi:hypothetical protein
MWKRVGIFVVGFRLAFVEGVEEMTFKMPRGAMPAPRSELAASEPYQGGVGSEIFVPSGEFPSPNQELAAAQPYKAGAAPESFLVWPIEFGFGEDKQSGSLWVEEAFAKACAEPRVVVPTHVITRAAQQCGSSNFAQFMQTHGFQMDGKAYLDGPFYSVNWTNAAILASAIYNHGPVKIGVAAEQFQTNPHGSVTPGTSGWAMYNYPKIQPEDHCVSLCGYGNLNDLVGLFHQHGVSIHVPSGMPTGLCYAMFTWNSIGIIDQQSMLNMTYEAWIRVPVTIVRDLDG